MSDLGLTHVAFVVGDLARSVAFYERYAAMQVVHRRPGPHAGSEVAWLSDLTRPFVIVLIQSATMKDRSLGPFGHLGVGLASRAEVDRLADLARTEGVLLREPTDSGPPVGYWTFLSDPDGNTLELAFGQEVAFTVDHAAARTADAPAEQRRPSASPSADVRL